MKKIKVLMVAGTMHMGGIENQLMHLARNTNKDEFQIDFTSSMQDAFYREEIEQLGGKFIYIPYSSRKELFKYCITMYRIMKEGQYDVVHSHELFHSGLTLFIAWMAGIKQRFAHAHNWCEGDVTGGQYTVKRKLYHLIMRGALSLFSTDQIACSSWAGRFLYGQRAIKKDTYHLVYNSVDTKSFIDKYNNVEQGEFVDDEWINVINVARISKVKNQEFLVEIAEVLKRKNRKIRILCAGNGDTDEVERIKRLISKKQVGDYIKLLGIRKDIDILMRKSKAFILPSLYEGMPLVMIEAQAAGLPCLSANTYSPEVDFGLGNVQWIPLDKSAEYWADQLANAVKMPRMDKEKIVEVINHKGFDAKVFSERLCALYKNAVWRNKRRINILFFAENLSEGGAEKVLRNLVNNMDQTLFNITVQTVWPVLDSDYIKQGIRYKSVFDVENKITHFLYRLESATGIIYPLHVKNNYDIEVAYLECGPTKVISKSTNRNALKLAWVHCDLTKKEGVSSNPKKSAAFYKKYDKVICVSEDVKQGYDRLFGSEKSVVIYNVIDETEILEKSKTKVEYAAKGKKLLAIGRLSKQKRFDKLIETAISLKELDVDFTFTILGSGEEYDTLTKLIVDNRLQEKVKLLGHVNNPYPYIKESDYVICSSEYEGFSTVVVEALILGKPVITTPCTGMREILGESEYGIIVDSHNVDDLTTSILKLIKDTELENHYIQQAIFRGQQFSKEKTVKDTQKFFIQEVKRKRSKH